ncbi:hypothetical protein BFC17_04390 [Alteromonas lipolytica]|uniref:2-hydroxyglutaryl-CoA dehydratase n=1 Tax=Alteromonas lipolytica TaxID=1856405 RepID=A0A1E8FCI9_9ALTE|nr:hypothetical protein BFC17_04390 [Alteromonas lipolytica]
MRGYQKEWYANLRQRVEGGEPFLLVEAMTPHEIFESFDIPFVTNEWWSGIVAAKRLSPYYFDLLEQKGFSKGLERYCALSLAGAIDNGAHPEPAWGGLPKPAMYVQGMPEATRVEFGERNAAEMGVPFISLAQPLTGKPMPLRWWETSRHGWEALCPAWQIDYLQSQYGELIKKLEEITGRKFDSEKLREVNELSNRQQRIFEDIRNMIITSPKSPVALSEMLGNVMAIQWQRGTQWAVDAATSLRDEIRARVDAQQYTCPNEEYRFAWYGPGLWQNTAFYRMFEESYGAVFVQSIYMSLAIDAYPRYGADTVRALASRYCAFGLYTMDWQVHEALTHGCEGIVTVKASVNGLLRAALERADIPLLVLDIDLVDGRTWDEEAVKQAMGKFIEEQVKPRRARLAEQKAG